MGVLRSNPGAQANKPGNDHKKARVNCMGVNVSCSKHFLTYLKMGVSIPLHLTILS